MHDQRRSQRQAVHPSKPTSADGKVGKTTRVAAELGGESVQRRAKAGGGATVVQLDGNGAGLDAATIHHHAARGVSGSASALPFAAEIQRSFGAEHDVSSVQAFIGGPATEAASSIGANAYAMGDQVAFASTPDLHLAAHEAAHVVQQKAGVHLSDKVGRSGDVYERHADAVADLVVQGKSAEALLDQMAPRGSTGAVSAVQRNASTAAASYATARPGTLVTGGAHPAGGTLVQRDAVAQAAHPPAATSSQGAHGAQGSQGAHRNPAQTARELSSQVTRLRGFGSAEKSAHQQLITLRHGPQNRATGSGMLGVANRIDNAMEHAEAEAVGGTIEAAASAREHLTSAWNAIRPSQSHESRPAQDSHTGTAPLPEIGRWNLFFIHLNTANQSITAFEQHPDDSALQQIRHAVEEAQRIYRTLTQEIQHYRDRIESGGATSISTLEGVIVACGIVATICTGGMAAAAGAGMVGGAAVAGGTAAAYTAATEGAGQVSEVAHGLRGEVNMTEILTHSVEAGATAFLGAITGGIGGRLFTGVFRRVAGEALARAGAARGATALAGRGGEFIMDFIGGSTIGPILNTAVRAAINRMRGRRPTPSYGELCDTAVHEMFDNVSVTNALTMSLGHAIGRAAASPRAAHAAADVPDAPAAPRTPVDASAAPPTVRPPESGGGGGGGRRDTMVYGHPNDPAFGPNAPRRVPDDAASASSGLRYGPDGRLLPPEAAVGTFLNPGPATPATPLTITPQHPAYRPGIDGPAAARLPSLEPTAPARPETRVQEMTTVDPSQPHVGAPQPASFTAGQVGTGAPLPPVRAIDPTPVAVSPEPYLLPSDWEGLPRGEHVDGVRTVYDPPADRGEHPAWHEAQREAGVQHEIEMESLAEAMRRAALRRAGSSGPPIGHTPWNEPIYASPQSTPVTSTGATPPRWRDLDGNWHFPNDGHVITRATQEVSTQESWAVSRLNAAHDNATAQTNSTFAPGSANRGETANLGSHADAQRNTASQTSRAIDERIQIDTPHGVMSHEGGALRGDPVTRQAGPLPEGELVAPRAAQQPTPRGRAPDAAGHILTGDASGGNAVVRVGTDNRSVLRPSEAGSMPAGTAPEHVQQEIRDRVTREERESALQNGEDPESTGNVDRRERFIASALAVVNDPAARERAAHVASHGESVQAPDVAQHTTGISSCAGLAVQGTVGGGERYRSLTHAEEFNPTTQYERLVDEFSGALRSGAEDIRGVASIDPRARQRPANVADQINDHYHSFPTQEQLPRRIAASLAAAHPDYEFRVDGQAIVATPQGGGSARRIQVQVEEAELHRGNDPVQRAMTVTRDGIVIRSQETGARRVIPWSRLGRQP